MHYSNQKVTLMKKLGKLKLNHEIHVRSLLGDAEKELNIQNNIIIHLHRVLLSTARTNSLY